MSHAILFLVNNLYNQKKQQWVDQQEQINFVFFFPFLVTVRRENVP